MVDRVPGVAGSAEFNDGIEGWEALAGDAITAADEIGGVQTRSTSHAATESREPIYPKTVTARTRGPQGVSEREGTRS